MLRKVEKIPDNTFEVYISLSALSNVCRFLIIEFDAVFYVVEKSRAFIYNIYSLDSLTALYSIAGIIK